MKNFVVVQVPAVYSTFLSAGTIGSGFAFPFITLGGSTAATGTTAASGLAITGLTAASATLAGFGGRIFISICQWKSFLFEEKKS